MSRQKPHRTGRAPSADAQAAPPPQPAPVGSPLTPEQVERWARLIAEGKTDLPADVGPDDRERLIAAVRPLLRARLVRWIARAIAADLAARPEPDTEVAKPCLSAATDPSLAYRYARYGRMSDPGQNRRSPDQQFATIEEVRERSGYPWVLVKSYRDDGITGRLLRRRPAFQGMLRDIETGVLVVDLIAVDTLERLGRAEEIPIIRHKLATEFGVLVVTGDTNFHDPTGVVGKALGLVENVRATEDGRLKAHNVVRGKKDCARLKRWPGGPAPLGYRLRAVVDESQSAPSVYHVLEPEPESWAVMQLTFQKAYETGWGTLRVTQWYNANPAIADKFKPASEFTIGYRLTNRIYVGELV